MKVTLVATAKANVGRGAAGKVPVFGLLKRGGKVYAVVIADAKAATLLPILRERIVPDSIVYSDALPSYNALDGFGLPASADQSLHALCRR